jgi:hypothetical protein
MEALAVAASVAGLISLANEIPKLIDTALSIKAAPEEAQKLAQTVNALVGTLEKLEAFLKSEEARDMKLADDSGLTVPISACQSKILDLSKKLYSHSPKRKGSGSASRTFRTTVTNFKWPFDKKHCVEMIAELHAMQSTFQFCLVLKNWYLFLVWLINYFMTLTFGLVNRCQGVIKRFWLISSRNELHSHKWKQRFRNKLRCCQK